MNKVYTYACFEIALHNLKFILVNVELAGIVKSRLCRSAASFK